MTSIKVVLLGDSGVGKTSLINRYVKDIFNDIQSQTVGASFLRKSIVVNGDNIELSIWDTAGQEIYRTLTPIYYRDSQAVIIVFSLDDKRSFNSIDDWLSELNQIVPDVPIVICGNKFDIEDEKREVSFDEAFAKVNNELRMPYFETSAKTGLYIDDAFMQVTKLFLTKKKNVSSKKTERPLTVQIGSDDLPSNLSNEKKGCC